MKGFVISNDQVHGTKSFMRK